MTTDTPTPCRPPEISYTSCENLPPACSCVIITSAADIPSPLWIPTGIPRPSSDTDAELSVYNVTTILLQCPANASSIELSTTSYNMWCNPLISSVLPMYIPGRFRTASRPLRTLIESASYNERSFSCILYSNTVLEKTPSIYNMAISRYYFNYLVKCSEKLMYCSFDSKIRPIETGMIIKK